MPSKDPAVHRDDALGAYVIERDGERLGLAAFRQQGGTVVFTHTEVDPAHEGEHLGGTLVGAALDDVRARGERIVPLCPFVAAYVQRHPEYGDLVES